MATRRDNQQRRAGECERFQPTAKINNPLHAKRLYNIITATKGRGTQTLVLNTKDKFTRTEAHAKRFPNADAAIRHASSVLRRYPVLREYHFSIRFAFG